jgi:tryptophan synthase beta subunit
MMQTEGRLPNSLIACIGGGSNAIGLPSTKRPKHLSYKALPL